MIVYDFDKTVYRKESGTEFFLYCLKRRPQILLWLPVTGFFALLYYLKLIPLKRFKEAIFGYLRLLKDTESLLESFWSTQENAFASWLPPLLPQGGLVISASPEFLIAGACTRLGLSFIGTRMDIRNGKITGENCRDYEKPRRFREVYPADTIEVFYSDSLSDTPLAELSREAWLVGKDRLTRWPDR